MPRALGGERVGGGGIGLVRTRAARGCCMGVSVGKRRRIQPSERAVSPLHASIITLPQKYGEYFWGRVMTSAMYDVIMMS